MTTPTPPRRIGLNWGQTFDVAKRAIAGFARHDGGALAGYIAYSVLLAFFPFLIFAFKITGILLGPYGATDMLSALFEYAPEHIALTLEPVVSEVLDQRTDGLLTISFLMTMFVASNAVEAFRTAFDRAYGFPEQKGMIRGRLTSMGFVLGGALVAAMLSLIIILGPLIIRQINTMSHSIGFDVPLGINALRYFVGGVLFAGFLMAMHRLLPKHDLKITFLWRGVFVSVLLWVIAATLFSVYLSYAPSYTLTYGSIAGVIVTLLFFYITGAIIIFGAEVNAAIHGYERRQALEELDEE
ncbi:YihY/virulence factor BrkB family protein [Paracoccaceae bacterium GXU_MW_L88]